VTIPHGLDGSVLRLLTIAVAAELTDWDGVGRDREHRRGVTA